MDAAQRELSDQIDFATQRLLDDARTTCRGGPAGPVTAARMDPGMCSHT